ncbi:MAG: hypothetical protein KatS3mg110_1122 [Pirellulaceae bacterium]|nr:MAG: hypothetical protein KatS3mg110_1122 [Pirellulaceae bacterium]
MSAEPLEQRLEAIVDQFLEHLRHGEEPSVDQFCRQYPELSEQLRAVLPVVSALETAGAQVGDVAAVPSHYPPLSSDPFLQQPIGKYRLVRAVGKGGMGKVYYAVEDELDRPVAVKVMWRADATEPAARARFDREARLLASLNHPHIVPIYHYGHHEGWHYLVMRWIDGLSLDQLIPRLRELKPSDRSTAKVRELLAQSARCDEKFGSQPAHADSWDSVHSSYDPVQSGQSRDSTFVEGAKVRGYFGWVARVGAVVADVLQFAHEQGVLHRDIKPSNVLIDLNGAIWVTDFGLAKRHEDQSVTRTGEIVGTPRYMAPERFRGWSDPRSDVYSLGIMLYELLTLRPAFAAVDVIRLVRDVCHVDPVRPRKFDPAIPADLETIVRKAIAKEPAERYQTAGQLRDDLQRFLAGEPIRARRTSPARRLYLWSCRNPVAAVLAACLLALLLIGGVGSMAAALHFQQVARRLSQAIVAKNEALGQAERARQTAEAAAAQLRSANRSAEERLYQVHLARAQASRWSRRAGQHVESLSGLAAAGQLAFRLEKTPADFLHLRNAAIASMSLVDVAQERTWPSGFPQWFDSRLEYGLRPSAEGTEWIVVRLSDDEELLRIPHRGGTLRQVLFSPAADHCVLFYNASDNVVEIWNVARGTRGAVLPTFYRYATMPVDLHPDGQVLAVLENTQRVQFFELASGKLRSTLDVGPHANRIHFSPDGAQIAVATMDPGRQAGVQIWQVSDGQKTAELNLENTWQWIHGLAWSHSGRSIAVGTEGGNNAVLLWEYATGKPPSELMGHTNAVIQLYFTPDDQLLISRSWDQTVRIWSTASRSELLRIEGASTFLDASGSRLAVVYSEKRGTGVLHRIVRPIGCWNLAASEAPLASFAGLFFTPQPNGIVVADQPGVSSQVTIPVNNPNGVLVCPRASSLIISSSEGLLRWPIRLEEKNVRIGPPVLLAEQQPAANSMMGQAAVAASADGQVVAYSAGDRRTVWVIHRAVGLDPFQLEHPGNHHHLSVSPDGRWTITGAWLGDGLRVWDNHTGDLVRDLDPACRSALAKFSPDGRWLGIWVEDRYELWATGGEPHEWYRAHVFAPENKTPVPGRIAFSPDGTVLALAMGFNTLDLYDLKNLEPVASLPGIPGVGLRGPIRFSPEGKYLFGHRAKFAQIWDLEAIEQRLSELGLASGQLTRLVTNSAVRSDGSGNATGIRGRRAVKIELGYWPSYQKGRSLAQAGKVAEAIAALTESLQQPAPHDAIVRVLKERAQVRQRARQWDEAIQDWSKLISLKPDVADYYQRRAACWFYKAYFGNGDPDAFAQARSDLDQVLRRQPQNVEARWLRARCAIYLGDHYAAREDCDFCAEVPQSRHRALELKSELFLQEGRYAEAAEAAAEALRLHPTCRVSAEWLALAHAGSGEEAQAALALNGLLAQPDLRGGWPAWLLDRRLRMWQGVVEKSPRSPTARTGRALNFVRTGNWSEGIAELQLAARLWNGPAPWHGARFRPVDIAALARSETESEPVRQATAALGELKSSEQRLDEIPFVIPDEILLVGPAAGQGIATRAGPIPINAPVTRLHFLHNVAGEVDAGKLVGQYRVRYADGKTLEISLRVAAAPTVASPATDADGQTQTAIPSAGSAAVNGCDVAPYDGPFLGPLRIAWIGSSPAIRLSRHWIWLAHGVWQNPYPGSTIQSLELVVTHPKLYLICPAITIELPQ